MRERSDIMPLPQGHGGVNKGEFSDVGGTIIIHLVNNKRNFPTKEVRN